LEAYFEVSLEVSLEVPARVVPHHACPGLTPISIKNNPFLELIILEQTPLVTCFGFVTRQTWLVSRRINLRKVLF
jgi:hypothetical protein